MAAKIRSQKPAFCSCLNVGEDAKTSVEEFSLSGLPSLGFRSPPIRLPPRGGFLFRGWLFSCSCSCSWE